MLYNGDRDNNLEDDLTLLDVAVMYKWKKVCEQIFSINFYQHENYMPIQSMDTIYSSHLHQLYTLAPISISTITLSFPFLINFNLFWQSTKITLLTGFSRNVQFSHPHLPSSHHAIITAYSFAYRNISFIGQAPEILGWVLMAPFLSYFVLTL